MTLRNIWGSAPHDAFLRKTFTLDRVPENAYLRIYVDTSYELWLNGRIVASVDEWCNTRDYRVALFLREGENVVAVHAMNRNGHRGCALELVADGETIVVSDGSWKASTWERWDWTRPGYDDSAWEAASVRDMSAAGEPQWWTVPGSDPERIVPTLDCSQFFYGAIPKACASPYWNAKPIQYIPDPKVVEVIGEEYAKFASEEHLQPIQNAVRVVGSTMKQDGEMLIAEQTERYTGPSFIADFDGEMVGFFRIRFQSEEAFSFRLYYGEKLDEAMSEPPFDTAQNRMLREEYRVQKGVQEFESRMRVGFRFVRVEFYNAKAPIFVDGCSVRTTLYPVARKGYFRCDDEKLNRLWMMGERTSRFCMQEYYLDAPKRDRFLWTGDTRMQALINYYTFADTELFEFCWKELTKCQFPNGGIPASYGEGCSILWDYVAWYVIAFEDYYDYTGKLDFVLQYRDALNRAVDFLTSLTDETGLICVPENPLGRLWMVTLNTQTGYDPFMNEIYCRSLKVAERFAKIAGDSAAAEKYRAQIAKTEPALLARNPEEEMLALYENTGHSTLQYELGEIEIHRGDLEAMLRRIDAHWAGMLESGADCTPEGPIRVAGTPIQRIDQHYTDSPGYGSLCHAWTAGPTVFLPVGLAGILPLEPGFRTVQIKPQLVGVKEFRCVVPTPHGEIAVKAEDGVLTYVLPEGVTGKLIWNGEEREICGFGAFPLN